MSTLFRIPCFDFGKEQNQKFADKIINHNANKLITIKNQILDNDQKNIFYKVDCASHYTKKIVEGMLVFTFLEKTKLCETIFNSLATDDFIENCVLKYAEKISKEKLGRSFDSKEKISGTICSCCNKYSYINNPTYELMQNNVVALIANILLHLLADHHLINGNKRTAYSFLVNALYQLGYYFKFSRSSEQFDNEPYKKIYEKTLVHFVEEMSRCKTAILREALTNKVCEWIFQNLLIAYRFV